MHDSLSSVEVRYDEDGHVVPLDENAVRQNAFGEKAARQMDASFEPEHDSGTMSAKQASPEGADDPRGNERPAANDYRDTLEGMDHDDRVAATKECLNRRGTFRDILYGLLGFCEEERSYEEIEDYVKSFTEFHRNRQEPQRYAYMLLRCGALEEIELDENGNRLTEADKQAAIDSGMAPEDTDELVYDWLVKTTDVGREVHEDLSPEHRLERLLESYPERTEAFAQIMEFCETPRGMGAIDDAFKGKPVMGFDEASKQKRQPSSYIEKLEAAGALKWDGSAWSLTGTGRDYLKSR